MTLSSTFKMHINSCMLRFDYPGLVSVILLLECKLERRRKEALRECKD
jgi:hypothetical protein